MEISGSRRHERKIKVSGISRAKAIEQFEYGLKSIFNSKRIEDKGQYVVLHYRIDLLGKGGIDIIAYTSDVIFISGSPRIPKEKFDKIANQIGQIAQHSVKRLVETRPITLQRAEAIIRFAFKLNPDNEYERMVIVILADTSNEIVLTESMKSLNIKGDPLKAGIPVKIKKLKEKGKVPYKEEEIINIRELRNRIVHEGTIPTKEQATRALKVAQEVLKRA